MANKELTINQFIKAIADEKDLVQKRLKQIQFELGTEVLKLAKAKANENFGRGGGRSARTKGRSGALRRSGTLAYDGEDLLITFGGGGVPYAQIQEFGTRGRGGLMPPIVPREKKWLTIPVKEPYFGKRGPEFDLYFRLLGGTTASGGAKAALFEKFAPYEMAYFLTDKVEIPPRPYLSPALDEIMTQAAIKKKIQGAFVSASIDWEVT